MTTKKNSFFFYFIRNVGTSIGFKNIASKIAYDLRLWLNSKPEQYPSQQSKSLDNDDRGQYNIVEEDDDEDEAETNSTVNEASTGDDGTSISQTGKSSSSSTNRRNTTSSSKSSGSRNSNIKLGIKNNIIASLLRTTTL